jgi:hypothetical protein
MARQNLGGGPPTQNTIYSVEDLHGNLILEVRQEEYMVLQPNSPPTLFTRYQNILLVCRTVWNPSMLQAKPPVLLGVCEICRNPPVRLFGRERPTHGLVAVYRAKLCSHCGTLCCPRHRREHDGRWLCLSCASRHGVVRLLTPIFFRKEE